MKKALLAIILILLALHAFNQENEVIKTNEVVTSGGDDFRSSNISLSWTLGEAVIETVKSNNFFLTQGFQQNNFIITSIDNLTDNYFRLNIFPNPAKDFFYIAIDDKMENINNYKLIIYDLQGNEIIAQDLSTLNEKVNISQLRNNIYLLKIIGQKHGYTRTFKLEKLE